MQTGVMNVGRKRSAEEEDVKFNQIGVENNRMKRPREEVKVTKKERRTKASRKKIECTVATIWSEVNAYPFIQD